MPTQSSTLSTSLVVTGEFGPLDGLADEAHGAYIDGFSQRAVLLCRHFRALSEHAGDVVTSRYLHYVEAVALQELGRHVDAAEAAEALLVGLGDAHEPMWRAKALSVVAEASTMAGAHRRAMAAMAEADWLLRDIEVGTYGHLSASMAVALALRSVNLLEEADTALSAIRGGGSPSVDLLVWQELALLSAHWATSLTVLGRDADAAPHFALTAGRSRRMWRLARAVDDHQMMARALVIEAYAMMRLGDVRLAASRLDEVRDAFSARPELIETHLMHLVLAASAQTRGDDADANDHLEQMLKDAESAGHELWVTAATVALANLFVSQHGTNRGLELWRSLGVAGLHKVWAEREARFAALNDRHALRRLSEHSDRVEVEVLTDPLTGLGNRRALVAALAEPVAPEWAVFVDLDDFKSVNDLHSHAVGDVVLRRVAELLRAESRAGDVAVRFGGDEFVVLPAGGRDAAERLARRIHGAVAAHPWDQVSPGLQVTVSVGTGPVGSEDTPLAAADAAVHASKRAGRNRVTNVGHLQDSVDRPGPLST